MLFKIQVPSAAQGLRLDKFLSSMDEIQSRSRALLLIEAGRVLVNGKSVKASYLLSGSETIEVHLPEPAPTELKPLDLPLEILFEDEFLLVLNKPAGLVVHPAAGHEQDTLVNALIAHSNSFAMKFGDQRPGIVHRLDKDTSGIMVVAKTDRIQQELSQQFKERSIHRIYFAVVCGLLRQEQGTIKSFLARHPVDRKKFASVRGRDKKNIVDLENPPKVGKWAQTDFFVEERHPSGFSYVRLKLHTGRTHQIRVHLSESGFPILGDELYGGKRKNKPVPRFALHAAELGFRHPATGESLMFKRDWPEDLLPLVENLFRSHSK